jgi:hypothetical protein
VRTSRRHIALIEFRDRAEPHRVEGPKPTRQQLAEVVRETCAVLVVYHFIVV